PLRAEGGHADHLPAWLRVPVHPDQRVRQHRLRPPRPGPSDDLLLPHRPARGPRIHRAGAALDRHDQSVQRPLLARGAPWRRSARHLLALRGHHVDRRLHDRLRHLRGVDAAHFCVLDRLCTEAGDTRFARIPVSASTRRGLRPCTPWSTPLRGLCRAMLNPLRSEDEAFRFLLYAIAVIGAIVGIVLILRAILESNRPWGRSVSSSIESPGSRAWSG